MGAATGGRHTVVGASTIRTLRRTVALTGATVIILMGRLTMITTPELMIGRGVRMAPMALPLPVPVTIPTRERTREAVRSQHPMAVEVQHRRTTRTPEPMLRPDKVRVRTLSGVAPMCREEIKALPWGTTRLPMEQ
jgi:hypothetical protein